MFHNEDVYDSSERAELAMCSADPMHYAVRVRASVAASVSPRAGWGQRGSYVDSNGDTIVPFVHTKREEAVISMIDDLPLGWHRA